MFGVHEVICWLEVLTLTKEARNAAGKGVPLDVHFLMPSGLVARGGNERTHIQVSFIV